MRAPAVYSSIRSGGAAALTGALKNNLTLRHLVSMDRHSARLFAEFYSPAVTQLIAELWSHYRVPHVRHVARTRVMCQAGRARAACARSDVAAWLCERAPLWVVVHVCALLRD